jgi:ABC-type branched-subunit amino acid transport system ATPase component
MSEMSSDPGAPILALQGLVAGYGRSEVLHGIDMEIRQGEIVTLVGANGAGKSTTLRTIFGQTSVRGGRISFKNQATVGRRSHDLVKMGLAFVPQERGVFPSLTVLENLEMGGYVLSKEKLGERVETMFERFPRLKERQKQKAGSLSGGERQMLAIARGLMPGPELLMLDEPSLGLAPLIVDAVFEQVAQINAQGTTVFLVEQNARRALAAANRAYVLELGKIRYQGTGSELLNNEDVQRAYLGG